MQWMIIHSLVDELQAVALALPERVSAGVGVGFAVYHPGLHAAMTLELRFNNQRDIDWRGRRLCIGLRGGELLIIPHQISRLLPPRPTSLVRIFDNDAHAGGLHVLAHFAKDPDAG